MRLKIRLPIVIGLFCLSLYSSAETPKILLDGPGQEPASLFIQSLLEKAYSNIGYEVEYQYIPLARSWVEADAGRIDGLRGRVGVVAERYPNLVRVPYPLLDFNLILIADRRVCGACMLPQIERIATIRGMEAARVFLRDKPDLEVLELTDTAQGIRMLQARKVQGFLASEPMIPDSFYETHPHWVKHVLVSLEDYHYLNRGQAMLVDEVSSELYKLEASGEVQKLRDKYGIELTAKNLSEVPVNDVTAISGAWVAARSSGGPYQKVLSDVFAGESDSFTYTSARWDIAKKAFYNGEVDLLVGAYEFEIEGALLSDLHIDYQPPVVAVANSSEFLSAMLQDSRRGTACYVSGYDFNQLLPENFIHQEADTLAQCVQRQLEGEVDVIVDYAKNLKGDWLTSMHVEEVLDSRPLFVVFHDSLRGKRLKSLFERELGRRILDGSLAALYDNADDYESAKFYIEKHANLGAAGAISPKESSK